MTLANVLLGMAIGFPMMIAVGPISVLLLDQGLERGIRAAAPAVVGVAAADLSLSSMAAFTGAAVAAALAPVTGWLTVIAVGVLVWLAAGLGRSAAAELRAVRRRSDHPVARPGVRVAAGSVAVLSRSIEPEPERPAESLVGGVPFAHQHGLRLAGVFYGLTLVNPLTLVLFASVVVAGGTGVGTAGWAVGMAVASLIAHGSFVVAGGLLGSALGPVASARLRLAAAVFMAALALHFALAL